MTPAKTVYFPDATGIVHVGANDGEEVAWYLENGNVPVLAFEPCWPAYKAFLARFGGTVPDNVLLSRAALGCNSRWGVLNVDGRGSAKASSLHLPEPTNRDPLPTQAVYVSSESVAISRFDDLVHEGRLDLAPYNTLVVDVEGHEYDVLLGFGALLSHFQFAVVECSAVPVFCGQSPAWEVIALMQVAGFKQLTPVQPHDDIMFARAL